MSECKKSMSVERRRLVAMFSALAAMSGCGPLLLKGHQVLLGVWIGVMFALMMVGIVRLAKLKAQGL